MAWITKDSAGTKIERRAEPYLTEAMKAELEPVVQRYPVRRAAALMVLHAIQDKHGYLPYQSIEEAAAFLDTPVSQMLDTATFYDEFFTQAKGKTTLWVCESLSCEIMGADKLFDHCRQKLGIEAGETTPDGKFTLMHVQCLGACGGAPCALVEHHLHENLTVEKLDKAIDEAAKSDGHH